MYCAAEKNNGEAAVAPPRFSWHAPIPRYLIPCRFLLLFFPLLA
jgi:hypothetical protein